MAGNFLTSSLGSTVYYVQYTMYMIYQCNHAYQVVYVSVCMCVYLCVHLCVCTCVCVHMCVQAFVHVCARICICTCVCMCMCVCVCACPCMYLCFSNIYVHLSTQANPKLWQQIQLNYQQLNYLCPFCSSHSHWLRSYLLQQPSPSQRTEQEKTQWKKL